MAVPASRPSVNAVIVTAAVNVNVRVIVNVGVEWGAEGSEGSVTGVTATSVYFLYAPA